MPVSSGIRTKNNSSNLSTPDTNAALVKSPASESISKWKIPHYYKRSSTSNSSSSRNSRNNDNSNGNGRHPTNSTGSSHGSSGFGNQGFSSSNSTPKKLIIEEVKGRLSKARRNGKEMVFVNYTVQDDTSAIEDPRRNTNAGGGSTLKGASNTNTSAKNNGKGSRNVDTVGPPSQSKPPIPTKHGHVSSRKPTRKRMLKIFNSSRSSSTSFPGTVPNSSVPASMEQLVPTSTYMNRSISSPNLITEEVVMPTVRPVKLKKSYTNMSLKYASRVRKSSIPKNSRNQNKQSSTPPFAPVSVSEPVYTNEPQYFNLASVNPDTTLSPLSQQRNSNDNVDNINVESNMNDSSSSGFLNDTVIMEEEVVPISNNPTSVSFGGTNANYINMFQLSDSPTVAPFQHNSQNSGNNDNSNNFTDNMQDMVYMGLDFNDQLSFGAASHPLGNTHAVPPLNSSNFSQGQAQIQSYGSIRPMYRNSTGNIAGIAPDVRFVDQQQQAYISGPQYGTPTIKEEETQPMTSGEKVRKGSKDNDASIAFSKVFALSRPAPINRNSMYSQRSLSATNVATGSAAANLIVKKTRRRPTSVSAASSSYSQGNIKSPARGKIANKSASNYRVGSLSIVPDIPEGDLDTSVVNSAGTNVSANGIAAANFLDSQTVTSSNNSSTSKGGRSKQSSISEPYGYQLPVGNSRLASVDSGMGGYPQLSNLATPVLDNSVASQAYFHPPGSATLSNSVTSTPSIIDFNNSINNCVNLSLSSIRSQSTDLGPNNEFNGDGRNDNVNSNFNFTSGSVSEVHTNVASSLNDTNAQVDGSGPTVQDVPVVPLRRSSLTNAMNVPRWRQDHLSHQYSDYGVGTGNNAGRGSTDSNTAEIFSYKTNQSDSTLVISAANQGGMNRTKNSSEFVDNNNIIRFAPQTTFVSNVNRSRNNSRKGNGNRSMGESNPVTGVPGAGALFINTNCDDYRGSAAEVAVQTTQAGPGNDVSQSGQLSARVDAFVNVGTSAQMDTIKPESEEEESLIQQMYREFNFENPDSFFHKQSKLLNLDVATGSEDNKSGFARQGDHQFQMQKSGDNLNTAMPVSNWAFNSNNSGNGPNVTNDANLDYNISSAGLANGRTNYPTQNLSYTDNQPDIERNR